MSPRLFGKGRKTHRREPAGTRRAVLVDYRMSGVNIGHLEDFYTRTNFPESLGEGMMVHIGGVLDGTETVYLAVWNAADRAEASWQANRRHIEETLADAPPDAEITRRVDSMHRLYLGDELGEFRPENAKRKPDCVGIVIDLPKVDVETYELICDQMSFPDDWPDGLLLHFAGAVEDVLRIVSVWRRTRDARKFFADRLIPASVEVARDHGKFAEIRPVELKVQLLVVGDEPAG